MKVPPPGAPGPERDASSRFDREVGAAESSVTSRSGSVAQLEVDDLPPVKSAGGGGAPPLKPADLVPFAELDACGFQLTAARHAVDQRVLFTNAHGAWNHAGPLFGERHRGLMTELASGIATINRQLAGSFPVPEKVRFVLSDSVKLANHEVRSGVIKVNPRVLESPVWKAILFHEYGHALEEALLRETIAEWAARGGEEEILRFEDILMAWPQDALAEAVADVVAILALGDEFRASLQRMDEVTPAQGEAARFRALSMRTRGYTDASLDPREWKNEYPYTDEHVALAPFVTHYVLRHVFGQRDPARAVRDLRLSYVRFVEELIADGFDPAGYRHGEGRFSIRAVNEALIDRSR